MRQVRPGGVALVAPLPGGRRPRHLPVLLLQGGACAHPDRPGSDALSARDRPLTTRLSPPFPRSRRRGSPRAASAPGWSRPSGATPGRTPTSSCASSASARRCVRSPRPTGFRCPLRARSIADDPSLPSVPSQPPYPGCTCAGCGASETSAWKTAPTGEHAGKPVCKACYWREKRANAKKRR